MMSSGVSDDVVLVGEDGHDRTAADGATVTMPKLAAHRQGLLHRAVSAFLFDGDKLLLQRRATTKYHSPSLWTNTCCTHPRPGERPQDAAHRRLREEMGIECALSELFTFTYNAPVGAELVEHEYDHVFVGGWSGSPAPDPGEVADWRWVRIDRLRSELEADPGAFTPWLPLCLDRVVERL